MDSENRIAKRPRLSLPASSHALSDEYGVSLNVPPKSEVFELLAERGGRSKVLEKEVRELQEQNDALERKYEQSQGEVQALKDKLASLQEISESTKQFYKREKESIEEALRSEMRRTANNEARVKVLQNEQASLAEHTNELENKLLDAKKNSGEKELKAEKKIRELEDQVHSLKRERDSIKLSNGPIQNTSEDILRRQKQRVESAEKQVKALSTQNKGLQEELTKFRQELSQSEADLRRAKQQNSGDNTAIIQSLRTELRSQEAEILAARRTLSGAENIAVLHEQLESAQKQITQQNEDLKKNSERERQLAEYEVQNQSWRSMAEELNLEDPSDAITMIQNLRQECLSQNESLTEKNREIKQLTESLEVNNKKLAESSASLISVQGSSAENLASASRLERRNQLLLKEKEALSKLLSSFEDEYAATDKSSGPQAQTGQIEVLKEVNETQKQQIEELEDRVSKATKGHKEALEQLAEKFMELGDLENKCKEHEKSIEELEHEASELQARLNKGEFNPEKTRVLHYISNPETLAQKDAQQARLRDLEAENSILRSQLGNRQNQSSESERGDKQPQQNAVYEAEILVLRQKISDLTKQQDRLKDVFTKTSANFREAVRCLFGYRIDMASEAQSTTSKRGPVTTYVLKPQYADNSRMQLMFQFKNGTMTFLPTEYTQKWLTREVDTFIERFKSIPAFTANWTMDLFQKQSQH